MLQEHQTTYIQDTIQVYGVNRFSTLSQIKPEFLTLR